MHIQRKKRVDEKGTILKKESFQARDHMRIFRKIRHFMIPLL